MKLLVTITGHFRSIGSDVFHHHLTYDRFWKRYLKVFDSVMVVARVKPVKKVPRNWYKSTGPGVKFCALPDYHGPWQYLQVRGKVKSIIKEAVCFADSYILRVPSNIGTVLWHYLRKNKIPYAVEVVADPWDALAPGSVKSALRPFFRWKMHHDLVEQCRHATVASYVTEFALQKRYPASCWSTYYSDVEVPESAILDGPGLESRIQRQKAKIESGAPLRLVYVGTLAQLYKASDILLASTAACIKKGLKLELVMVGDGQYRMQLEKDAEKLGIADKVHFTGWVRAGKEVFEQFDAADLFVLPSLTEGMPRALIEAMARGIPSIGSTVGGFPELLCVEDLVVPGDVESLVNKICEVIGDTNRLEAMSRRNLKTVKEKFSPQELCERWVNYYSKVAELARVKS